MNNKRIISIAVCLIINTTALLGAVGLDINYISIGLWRLEGLYNNGSSYTSKPILISIIFKKKISSKIETYLDYQRIPTSILSPDCYQYVYYGTPFWIRQRLSFTDNRVKIGFAFSILSSNKIGEVTLGAGVGSSLNTLLKDEIVIQIENEAFRTDQASTGPVPPLEKGQKEDFTFGYTSLISTSMSWMKPLNRKFDLKISLEYDYVDYSERTTYPNPYSTKYFLIRYNEMLTVSLGVLYRAKR
jgi:hypothetical protein